MKQKSNIALILAAFIVASFSLVGCGNTSRNRTGRNNFTNNMQDGVNNNATNNAQDGMNRADRNDMRGNIYDNTNPNTQNAVDSARNAAGNAGNALRYTAQNFKDDITKAGYNVTDYANNTNNYFKGKETDYKLGGDIIRVYEYDSPQALNDDINRIAPDGMSINGASAQFASRPYYYRKGNSLILYEGKEPAYIDEFNRVYGKSLRQ